MPIKKTDIAVGKRYTTPNGEIRTIVEVVGKSHVSYVTEPESMRQMSALGKFLKDVDLAPEQK